MKAPDKICIRKDDTAPFGFTRHWIYTTKVQEQDIEYIRKDALLEYLYTAQGAVGSDFQKAVIQSVIDKLNSI